MQEGDKVDWSIPITVNDNTTYKCVISTHCLICDDPIDLNEMESLHAQRGKVSFKICDKCKSAVMKIRKEMET